MFKSVKKFLVKVIDKNQGSAAVILSLMVSGGVLSTIYFTQKMTGGFLSEHSQSLEEWEKHLVTESAQTLAAYLVANNLILCRQEGWTGKQSKCKWSTVPKTEKFSDFHLSEEKDSTEGLSYKGKYNLDNKEKEYKVTFQLVDWRSTSIESLIGDVPEGVCRNKNTLEVISDASCIRYEDSTDPTNQLCQKEGADVPDTLCEYIRRVDGDYWIVLTKVEVDYKDPISEKDLTHTALSGIRRPLSSVKFGAVITGRKCSLSCNIGTVVNPFPGCRGSVDVPKEEGKYTGKASNIISVKNEGPGAIYSISLLRESVGLTGLEDSYQEDVVSDLVKEARATEQVFLPGETVRFEYFYDCPIEVRRSTVYKVGEERVEVTSSTRDIPYESFLYSLSFSANNPVGVCYKSGVTLDLPEKTHEEVDFVTMNSPRLASASSSCTLGATACGTGGSCRFAGLEPARTFIIPVKLDVVHNGLVQEIVTTIYSKPPPPVDRIRNGDGSGDGDGGGGVGGGGGSSSDGSSCCPSDGPGSAGGGSDGPGFG